MPNVDVKCGRNERILPNSSSVTIQIRPTIVSGGVISEGFIHYSSLALKTGWYNSDLYYKRGIAFEQLNDFKHAKKEYEKAVKYGCDAAETALEKLKDHEKEWKERQQ